MMCKLIYLSRFQISANVLSYGDLRKFFFFYLDTTVSLVKRLEFSF